MRIDIRVDHDVALQRVLAELPEKIHRRVLGKALRQAAAPILQTARANVLAIRRTGRDTEPLARGLRIATLRRRPGRVGVAVQTPRRRDLVRLSLRRATRKGMTITRRTRLTRAVNSQWYYPAHIELGSKKAPARPYLRQALAAQREATLGRLRQDLWRGIEAEARRG